MSVERLYSTEHGIELDDEHYTDIDSYEDFEQMAMTAFNTLETLKDFDAAAQAYQLNTARRGRVKGLEEFYDDEDHVLILDDGGRVTDAFVLDERRSNLEDEADWRRDELEYAVDYLDTVDEEYGIEAPIRQLWGVTRMTMNEGRTDSGLQQQFKEEHPHVFFELFPNTSGSLYNTFRGQVLSKYIDESGSLQNNAAYGVLKTVSEGGAEALDAKYEKYVAQEKAFIQVLHENEHEHAEALENGGILEPTAYRVNKIVKANELEGTEHMTPDDRMFQ